MLKGIVDVRSLGCSRVHVRFENGVEADLDLGDMMEFKGIFAPLRDEKEFARVRVHAELGTILWPSGADLDPDVLDAKIAGKQIEMVAPQIRRC